MPTFRALGTACCSALMAIGEHSDNQVACERVSSARPAPSRRCIEPRVIAATLASAIVSLAINSSALAAPESETFTRSCAGCHAGGGNVVQSGASLFTEDLQRNGVSSPEAIYKVIYSGKNKMPGYGLDCAPRGACTFGPRLSDDELHTLTDYVLERAAADWK